MKPPGQRPGEGGGYHLTHGHEPSGRQEERKTLHTESPRDRDRARDREKETETERQRGTETLSERERETET